eukprot:10614756-Alexandrium_andersonii.AAC.1
MHAGLAHPLSHHLRAHAWVINVHVEAAPVGARGAPHEEVGPPRAQQADDIAAVRAGKGSFGAVL